MAFAFIQPAVLFFPVTYTGNYWDDTIHGGSVASNTIWGYGGDDFLYGNIGNDWLFGGMGNDHLYGEDGDDHIAGDYGDDWLYGGAGNDVISGEDGDDQISSGDGDDQVSGGEGVDHIGDTGGMNEIHGGGGNDWIYTWGFSYNNHVYGDDGDDYIESHTTLDTLHGGAGNDHIYGGEGDNGLYGDEGDDTLLGGIGNDTLDGGTGADKVFGEDGDDFIYLGTQTYAEGNAGNDAFILSPWTLSNGHFFADGGEGHDKAWMDWIPSGAPIDLSLSDLAGKVDSVEEVYAKWLNVKTTMHLNPSDILDFTETGVLQIDGNSNHTVSLENGVWKDGGVEKINGVAFHDYYTASGSAIVTVKVEGVVHVEQA
jgi:Ca2+-binding RTX toxin-like protein